MNKAAALLVTFLTAMLMAQAQRGPNANPDAIVGVYKREYGGQVSKVRIYKCTDGTYSAQCIYLKDSIDPKTGKLLTDSKNPNRELRNVPSNRVILIQGLRYNPDKQRWEKGRIYDPTRGLHARCTCEFTADRRLKLRGSVFGIGETVYWQPLKELRVEN